MDTDTLLGILLFFVGIIIFRLFNVEEDDVIELYEFWQKTL